MEVIREVSFHKRHKNPGPNELFAQFSRIEAKSEYRGLNLRGQISEEEQILNT